MKRNTIYKLVICFSVILAIFSSCKKESESIFTMYDGLKVDFRNSIGSDEVYAEFNLSKVASGSIMSKVILTETGSTTPVYTVSIPFAQRYSYASGVVILKTPSPQTVSYKITVLDDTGKDITSQVTIAYPAKKLIVTKPVLTTDKEIVTFAEGDTIYLDYTVTSADANLKYIHLYSYADGNSSPADVTIATVPDDASDKRTYRGAARLILNRDGLSKFRIYAKNEEDDYIGDGYKYVNTNVNAGFELTSNRFIYAPNATSDTTAGFPIYTAKCFYSISKKQAYSYEEAKAISADIDFGIYLTSTDSAGTSFNLNIYNTLDAVSGNGIIAKYDLSNWTKRDTKYSIAFDGAPFNSLLVSGKAITTEAKKYAILTTRKRVSAVKAGSLIYFITPEGKNGAILINNISRDFQGRYFANFDLKIVK